jgi:HlyD family secretion protein
LEVENEADLTGIGARAGGPAADGRGQPLPEAIPRGRRRRWRRWLAGGLLLVVFLGAGAWWLTRRPEPVRYLTEPVTRGSVALALTATGTVNPVTVVEVGTYVSGPIVKWYCDFNSRVTVGQLCAQIDPRPFQMVADQATANLAVARAQLVKDQASLAYARTTYERDVGLLKRGIVSQATVDSEKSAFDQAVAQVTYDESAIQERQAELNAAQINLGFSHIISPVDGVVVSRNIEVGQTVAASFQTPILFLIATDLTKMQVDTNVSESDIGGVKIGDKATFSVQTFPNRQFHGAVRQVRQAPTTVQNVVTYDVVVAVDNRDGALKPGMTATTRIVKDERDGVLVLPAQALRFLPEGVARGSRPGGGGAGARGGRPGGGPAVGAKAGTDTGQAEQERAHRRRVWVLRDDKPAAVPVTVGLDDGTSAEIVKSELKEGDPVIVAEATANAKPGAGAAGRAPGFFRPGGR